MHERIVPSKPSVMVTEGVITTKKLSKGEGVP